MNKKRNDRYKKFMEVKFRKWTESDDEYLKTFWNDNSIFGKCYNQP